MVIDCHGHYTTAPKELQSFRDAQIAALADPHTAPPSGALRISDDQLRESVQPQLKFQSDRGTDLTIFSPRASAMAHHIGDAATSLDWTRHCNDLIHRVCGLFPANFVAVCQLPQTPAAPLANCIEELTRCVNELGFLGCNLNPDPSGGHWTAPPLTDRFWYPFYETMVELNVPAMVHVSASCNANFHATGAHYINADTTAFMQFLTADLFKDFPTLRMIIPHGGGAVPYHWGRYRGLAQDMKRPPLGELIRENVFFDTCVYHQAGIDLLLKVIPADNILFGSEMVGAVRGIDPETGYYFDDTKRYIDAGAIGDAERRKILELNAIRVFPRIAANLTGPRPRAPGLGKARGLSEALDSPEAWALGPEAYGDSVKPTIVRNVPRAEAGVIQTLGALGVATVHEAQGRRGLLRPYMRPIYPTARAAGSALTVLCQPGDNLMIHAAMDVCRPGDILVVTTTSESTDGMFGELLAVSARAHGVVGLIIDAGVRDVADLTTLEFPVWSKAISAQGTVKATAGSVNVPVVCAGAAVHPGDVIVADVDGVVVVPRAAAADVARLSEERVAKEEKARQRLRNKELGLDFYGLRAKLSELGVIYRDE